jgi:cytochrome c
MKIAFAIPAMLAAAALLSAATPAAVTAAPDGAALFRQRCQGCHVPAAGQTPPLAPSLAGVVGRAAASTGFNYSPALKNSKLVWDRANLDKFLAGPMRMVPGTRMAIFVPDPQQRAAIIDYLARAGH